MQGGKEWRLGWGREGRIPRWEEGGDKVSVGEVETEV